MRVVAGLLAAATAAAAAAAAAAPTDALSAALQSVPFSAAVVGLTNNSDAYGSHALDCYYLEVEDVGCTSCSWGGACAVQTLASTGPAPPPSNCTGSASDPEGTDRPGGDFTSYPVASHELCASACCDDPRCLAWTYVTKLQAGTEDQCVTGGPCCWLKGSVPNPTPNNYPDGIWSGTAQQPPQPPMTVPPTGIRNAVPVGGLGAGTLELRGDGTFHELTFHSASPGGAAKYPTQPDMMLSLAVNGGAARALRTAPPAYAAPGVAQIQYAGAYPVSRLAVVDPSSLGAAGVSATLYAFHHLRPNDSPTSSAPAAVFTLSVTNGGAAPANVSLMLQLPMGAMRDCARVDFKAAATSNTSGYAACMQACAAAGAGCAAWNFDSLAAAGNCAFLPSAGRMVYKRGGFCGIRGAWDSSDGASLSLSLHPGDAPSEAGPAAGDVALRPVASGAGAQLSFAVSDDPALLFGAFAAGGGAFAPGSNGGVTGGSFAAVAACHGAVAVTSPMIAPGETASVSITFAWYFPHRDYYGQTVGQFYSTLFGSAKDVAGLYDQAHLAAAAADSAAHAAVFAGPAAATLPDWLADHMQQQFSHFRNFIYAADGTMREHEASAYAASESRPPHPPSIAANPRKRVPSLRRRLP
jgi:hypothetical protein